MILLGEGFELLVTEYWGSVVYLCRTIRLYVMAAWW